MVNVIPVGVARGDGGGPPWLADTLAVATPLVVPIAIHLSVRGVVTQTIALPTTHFRFGDYSVSINTTITQGKIVTNAKKYLMHTSNTFKRHF